MNGTVAVICFFVWLAIDSVFGKEPGCECCEELEDDLDELDVDLHREIDDLRDRITVLENNAKSKGF
jgi:hypothetical protein